MTVHAAGAVVWRPAGEDGTDEKVEVAIVHRPHHDDWSLPKGKVDPGETRVDAAVREIAEETGFASVLGRHLRTVRYPVNGEEKVVEFWAARAGVGEFVPGDETDELRWLAPADAAPLLTYDSDRDVLDTFAAHPAGLRTVLLVRHALAGKRSEWDRPDAERPLDVEGREQAQQIAALLQGFGIGAVHAVPIVRCRQTVEPYVALTGLTLHDAPDLADEAVADDEATALATLALLADGDVTAAVCAQGYGIPQLVGTLAATAPRPPESDRDLADPPCRKGSIWVLSFGPDGVLVAADYHRDATF
ncbi:8-oxo-dGTP diphosphatase [Actinomycetospora succinea]|uniref:8-oxo-dGTP diphosphatase n=1 Tax=Actinomycetospora succinea TaxID=663603 RepID=A0A4R6VY56_9PSEU|nr:NUDIX hydrolase [Actinomycetospora succinea]TDQ65505.1 8-oxo-dGTP diphosphatase [Actinomycetospora succinea]